MLFLNHGVKKKKKKSVLVILIKIILAVNIHQEWLALNVKRKDRFYKNRFFTSDPENSFTVSCFFLLKAGVYGTYRFSQALIVNLLLETQFLL